MKTTSAEHGQNLSYCGLVDATVSASEKDLPVLPDFVKNDARNLNDINDFL